MTGRGWYHEDMAKLKQCQIAEMKERQAIEVIADMKAGIVHLTHEQEKERTRDAIANITLKKLGLHFQFQN